MIGKGAIGSANGPGYPPIVTCSSARLKPKEAAFRVQHERRCTSRFVCSEKAQAFCGVCLRTPEALTLPEPVWLEQATPGPSRHSRGRPVKNFGLDPENASQLQIVAPPQLHFRHRGVLQRRRWRMEKRLTARLAVRAELEESLPIQEPKERYNLCTDYIGFRPLRHRTGHLNHPLTISSHIRVLIKIKFRCPRS